MNLHRSFVLGICLIVSILPITASNARDLYGEIILSGAENTSLSGQMEKRITAVINALSPGLIVALEDSFTPEGFDNALALIRKVDMSNAKPLHQARLLKLPDGEFEIRDIKVRVKMGETTGNPYQYLVFTLNAKGLIEDIRFAMESTHYKRLIDEGLKLQDFAYRQRILQFIEIFRTAHNRKDLDFLKNVYSDDALIIVGRVLEKAPEKVDMMENSLLSGEQIEFVRKSKSEYIESLAKVFAKNDFIRVVFDEIEITRDKRDKRIYGITLSQEWNSSRYSDKGWLFLMMDFLNPDKPIIHVRSWQPEPFADGSVVGLYDFMVIN